MPLRPTLQAARGLVVSASLLVAMAAAHAVPEAQFQPALIQFMQAGAGDRNAIAPAADAFGALLRQEPANPVLMAYTGAATAMKANTTWLPWKKMGHAEDGMALLDKALALLGPAHSAALQNSVPTVLEVKFVAANTFLAVPGFMNRGARGDKLLAEVLASPLFATAPLPFRGAVWLAAANHAAADKHGDEARKFLDQIIAANAPQAEAARAQLKALAP